jgi:hypothetical protein
MTIIVFDEYPTDNNTGYSIVAFAGFYLAGCAVDDDGAETGDACNNNLDDDDDGKVNDGCKKKGGDAEEGAQCDNDVDDDGDDAINDGCPVLVTEADIYDPDYPERRTCEQDSGGVGHVVVFGKFAKLVTTGGAVGPIDPSTTMFGIALTE